MPAVGVVGTDFPISFIITEEHQNKQKDWSKIESFNVTYQQRIRTVILFNSKLIDCAGWGKSAGAELANKTDNGTVSYMHRTGRALVQIK